MDARFTPHRRYLRGRPLRGRLDDLRQHVMIGHERDPSYVQLLEQRAGMQFQHDVFAFRSDSDFAQLAALRAGFGIGLCQLGIARRDRNVVPILHTELMAPMDVWLAMMSNRGRLGIAA